MRVTTVGVRDTRRPSAGSEKQSATVATKEVTLDGYARARGPRGGGSRQNHADRLT